MNENLFVIILFCFVLGGGGGGRGEGARGRGGEGALKTYRNIIYCPVIEPRIQKRFLNDSGFIPHDLSSIRNRQMSFVVMSETFQ